MSLSAKDIQYYLDREDARKAIEVAQTIIDESSNPSDQVYYLLGNAYRKLGDWQHAINNYLKAIEINPSSPANQAYQMANDILNFFNKDMYNQ